MLESNYNIIGINYLIIYNYVIEELKKVKEVFCEHRNMGFNSDGSDDNQVGG